MFMMEVRRNEGGEIIDPKGRLVVDQAARQVQEINALAPKVNPKDKYFYEKKVEIDSLKSLKPAQGTQDWIRLTELRGLLHSEGFSAYRSKEYERLQKAMRHSRKYVDQNLPEFIQAGVEMAKKRIDTKGGKEVIVQPAMIDEDVNPADFKRSK